VDQELLEEILFSQEPRELLLFMEAVGVEVERPESPGHSSAAKLFSLVPADQVLLPVRLERPQAEQLVVLQELKLMQDQWGPTVEVALAELELTQLVELKQVVARGLMAATADFK